MMTEDRRKFTSTFYLAGNQDEADRRNAALDALCERLGISRSKLMTNIADGVYSLCPWPGSGVAINVTELEEYQKFLRSRA